MVRIPARGAEPLNCAVNPDGFITLYVGVGGGDIKGNQLSGCTGCALGFGGNA